MLPLPEVEAGREVFYVTFPAQFRTLLVRYLQSLLREIGAEHPRARPATTPPPASSRTSRPRWTACSGPSASTDRRLGLVNLFWLAHTRDVAECLGEIEGKIPAVRKLKYSLHPLLSSFYRRLDAVGAPHPRAVRARPPRVHDRHPREHEPRRRAARRRVRVHRAVHLRLRLQPLPRRQQALPPVRGRVLRDLLRACSARRRSGCATATAACWPASPATCRCCRRSSSRPSPAS